MPTLKLTDGAAALADDAWSLLDDEAAAPEGGAIIVSFKRYLAERDALLSRNAPIGVRLSPEDEPGDLADDLDRLELIEVCFPKYADGRGYSQAQLLRRRYGYGGELRAVGEVLRDQLLFMARCGFDAFSFEPTSGDAAGVIDDAIAEFSAAYQAAADDQKTVFTRRHRIPATV